MKATNIEQELTYIDKVKELNKGKKLKYYIMTMGCQLNENDSEKLMGMLEKMNYEKTDEMKEADIVVFNTCCVRENAEERLFGKVGEVKKQKEDNRHNYCNWWLYDARRTHLKKIKRKLSICRYNIWNTYNA